jgi:hypothetical protein
MKRIQVGMTRAEVLGHLSDAWHHDACPRTSVAGAPIDHRDLFWYGPTDVTQASVVRVIYSLSPTSGDWVVDDFGLAEKYTLHAFYGHCTTLDLSPLSGPTVAP